MASIAIPMRPDKSLHDCRLVESCPINSWRTLTPYYCDYFSLEMTFMEKSDINRVELSIKREIAKKNNPQIIIIG